MPSKPKTTRREHSSETIAMILALKKVDKTVAEIARVVEIPEQSVRTILRRAETQPDQPYRKPRRTGRPPKLTERARRRLIRHMEANPRDNLLALSTPSKSGSKIHRNTVRKYLKGAGYFRYKARKKPYLTAKHKKARLAWAKEHLNWTLKDWANMIWMNEATFKVGFDSRTTYISCKPGTTFKDCYLKPSFKLG